jgi:hypothetical protein
MKRGHQPVRTHDDRSFRKLIVALANRLEVVSCRVGLADSSRRQIHDLVAIVANVRVELGNTEMCPITADGSKDMPESVGSGVSFASGEALTW